MNLHLPVRTLAAALLFTALKLGGAALTMAGVAWAQFGGTKGRDNARVVTPPDPG